MSADAFWERQKSWSHKCLRVPEKEGRPVTLVLTGSGGCLWCGDPGPEKQKQVDAEAAAILRRTEEKQ